MNAGKLAKNNKKVFICKFRLENLQIRRDDRRKPVMPDVEKTLEKQHHCGQKGK